MSRKRPAAATREPELPLLHLENLLRGAWRGQPTELERNAPLDREWVHLRIPFRASPVEMVRLAPAEHLAFILADLEAAVRSAAARDHGADLVTDRLIETYYFFEFERFEWPYERLDSMLVAALLVVSNRFPVRLALSDLPASAAPLLGAAFELVWRDPAQTLASPTLVVSTLKPLEKEYSDSTREKARDRKRRQRQRKAESEHRNLLERVDGEYRALLSERCHPNSEYPFPGLGTIVVHKNLVSWVPAEGESVAERRRHLDAVFAGLQWAKHDGGVDAIDVAVKLTEMELGVRRKRAVQLLGWQEAYDDDFDGFVFRPQTHKLL